MIKSIFLLHITTKFWFFHYKLSGRRKMRIRGGLTLMLLMHTTNWWNMFDTNISFFSSCLFSGRSVKRSDSEIVQCSSCYFTMLSCEFFSAPEEKAHRKWHRGYSFSGGKHTVCTRYDRVQLSARLCGGSSGECLHR